MYLSKTYTNDDLYIQATMSKPFGPDFSKEQLKDANSMEIWHSSFSDEGDDFTEFRLLKDGKTVHTKRIQGY